MAKVKLANVIKIALQKTGIDPEQYSEVIEAIEQEIEESTEGEIEQKLSSLITENDLDTNPNLAKGFRARVKAEAFNGFENLTLKKELSNLSDTQKAEYERKTNATEKTNYLFKCLKENGSSNKDLNTLQAKIDEFEAKITDGTLIDKSELEKANGTIKELKMGSFWNNTVSKVKGKGLVDTFLAEPDAEDIIKLKIDKITKGKGIYYDVNDGKFKNNDSNEVVKRQGTVKEFTIDDLVGEFATQNASLIKVSDGKPPVGSVDTKGSIDKSVDPNIQREIDRAKNK